LSSLYSLVRLARPSHWIKNTFVLAALVFARRMTDPDAWTAALEAFAVFCLASSAVYALNDVRDRQEDARHPAKRNRPVASGAVRPATALAMGLALAAAALALSLVVRPPFTWTVVAYLVLMLAYVLGLKRVAVLDVLILALGFVLRALAGAVAIHVEVSPWLVLCTLTLSLFLGFAKRESERVALGAGASDTRPIEWRVYDEKSLEHMMTVTASLAIVTYMLYTVSPRTIQHVGTEWIFITVLPVIFAVFRFYRLAITGRATGPVEMVTRDAGFVLALVVWLAMVAVLLFVFH
jgi:4-hydroxybenzoate polyprenyltransferase